METWKKSKNDVLFFTRAYSIGNRGIKFSSEFVEVKQTEKHCTRIRELLFVYFIWISKDKKREDRKLVVSTILVGVNSVNSRTIEENWERNLNNTVEFWTREGVRWTTLAPLIYSRKMCGAGNAIHGDTMKSREKEPHGNYFTSKLPKIVTRLDGNIRRRARPICDRRRKSFIPGLSSWSYFCSCMFNRDGELACTLEGFRARVHIRNTSTQIIHRVSHVKSTERTDAYLPTYQQHVLAN